MIGPLQKFFSIILVFFITLGSTITRGNEDADIKKIGQNITDGLLSGQLSPVSNSDIHNADTIISLTECDNKGNRYFTDIDYTNQDRTTWIAARHVTRTEKLAILYRLETDTDKKDEYRKIILGLLDYWIDKDYTNPNWWHNKLSMPNCLGDIGVLMKNDLSRKQLKKLARLVGRGSFTVDVTLNAYTGANAIDLSMSTIKFGALTGNRAAIKKAAKTIAGELKYSKAEGLKEDGTFFQHGNRLYMGGYGIAFINGITSVMIMLSGTDYIFSADQLKPFADFILDGLRYMSFGDILDPTTMGRSVSRFNAQPLRGTAYTLLTLSQIDEMPRKDEIADYVNSIVNNQKKDYGLRYYDNAKFIVINNSDFYFSFRGGDSKMMYSEMINDENILSYNSAFPGVTTIMHTGREYVDISPVYDYSFIPGATSVYETDDELKAHSDNTYRTLSGAYSDAVADGAAISAIKTSHDGIDMTITCFAVDNAAVILGAGIKNSKGKAMNTTIDQSYYTGSFMQDGNTVIHNGIKYNILSGGTVHADAVHRTGTWNRNNVTLPSLSAEADLFTLYLENNGSYAYSVMSENTDADFTVIENNESLQTVRLPNGRVAAVFFKNGNFSFNGTTYSGKAGEAKIY